MPFGKVALISHEVISPGPVSCGINGKSRSSSVLLVNSRTSRCELIMPGGVVRDYGNIEIDLQQEPPVLFAHI